MLSPVIYAIDECFSSPSLDRVHSLYEAHMEQLSRELEKPFQVLLDDVGDDANVAGMPTSLFSIIM